MWRGEEERGRSRLLFSSHVLPHWQSIMSDTRTTSETYNASDSDLTLVSNEYGPPTSAPSVVLIFSLPQRRPFQGPQGELGIELDGIQGHV
jgi:hypothetical protein